MFINFQTLSDTFESLIALNARLKQNQWQLFSNVILIKYNQSENDVKRINTEQQSKKPRGEKVSAPNQHKKWIDNKSKEGVICYQCNKKGHYKLQCSELMKEQPKNINQTSVRKVHVKRKDQHSQRFLWTQSEKQ